MIYKFLNEIFYYPNDNKYFDQLIHKDLSKRFI